MDFPANHVWNRQRKIEQDKPWVPFWGNFILHPVSGEWVLWVFLNMEYSTPKSHGLSYCSGQICYFKKYQNIFYFQAQPYSYSVYNLHRHNFWMDQEFPLFSTAIYWNPKHLAPRPRPTLEMAGPHVYTRALRSKWSDKSLTQQTWGIYGDIVVN